MRTDSVTVAGVAIAELRTLIRDRYGADNLPRSPRRYATKAKNAQEAHEAVRPTSAAAIPQELRSRLAPDQYRLYDLIWKRTVASQMSSAVFDTVRLELAVGESAPGDHGFRATGSVLVKPGYMMVYQEGGDDRSQHEQDRVLPPLDPGDRLVLKKLHSEQHFTEPPPRYSEATLVRALEECGIGRPSTYASIISTLRNREYVEMEARRFVPTDVGKVVNRFLYRALLPIRGLRIHRADGGCSGCRLAGRERVGAVAEDFWKPFQERVQQTEATVTREQVVQARPLGSIPTAAAPFPCA